MNKQLGDKRMSPLVTSHTALRKMDGRITFFTASGMVHRKNMNSHQKFQSKDVIFQGFLPLGSFFSYFLKSQFETKRK